MSFFPSFLNSQPSRRSFLQAALMGIMPLFMPKVLTAKRQSWFLHTENGESWAVDNPVLWSLENAQQPILERARKRLVTLDAADPERVIRLVTRRCNLNMIEVLPSHVVVQYWGKQGQGDLRPFFKQHRLARESVRVLLLDRKRETTTTSSGEDFLYGEPATYLATLELLWIKWQRRYEKEPDDSTAAPWTRSGFGWEGMEPNLIPWAALKSAWRNAAPFICLNCDQPTIMTNFGLPRCSMFNREVRFTHVCRGCHRLFKDDSVERREVGQWVVKNLDAEVLPDYDVFSGRSKWEPTM